MAPAGSISHKRVAAEHLGREQAAVLAHVDRVDAHQVGELAHRTVAFARAHDAVLDRSPHDGAVGEKDQVIGHAIGRADEASDRAVGGIDAVDAVADDTAGVQHIIRIEREAVHAVEGDGGTRRSST